VRHQTAVIALKLIEPRKRLLSGRKILARRYAALQSKSCRLSRRQRRIEGLDQWGAAMTVVVPTDVEVPEDAIAAAPSAGPLIVATTVRNFCSWTAGALAT
jgi:hypothetical protein